MNSPRYKPTGLLVQYGKTRLMIDGGPGGAPKQRLAAWLVSDENGELIRDIRKLARPMDLVPAVSSFSSDDVSIEPH